MMLAAFVSPAQSAVDADPTFTLHVLDGPSPTTPVYGASLGADNQLNVIGLRSSGTALGNPLGLIGGGNTTVPIAEDGAINVSLFTATYANNELFTLSSGLELLPGALILSTAPTALIPGDKSLSAPVPDMYQGRQFAIPHVSGKHKYRLLARGHGVTVKIDLAGSVTNLVLLDGKVMEFDAGSTAGIAGLITSSQPIYVSHIVETVSGRSGRPVLPLLTELWGMKSSKAYVAAYHTPTEVKVTRANGSISTIVMAAGQIVDVEASGAAIPAGEAIHVKANQGVSVVSYASTGSVTTFQPRWAMRSTFVIPSAATSLTAVCAYDQTVVEVFSRSGQLLTTATCSGPGKSDPSQVSYTSSLLSGARVNANKPFALFFNETATGGPHASIGVSTGNPVRPIPLAGNVIETESNPHTLSVFSEPGTDVNFSQNGQITHRVRADQYGLATAALVLFDGVNEISVTAYRGSLPSESLVVFIDYINTTPRAQTGTISADIVWTRGDGRPYIVNEKLTIAEGATLTILPGTEVRVGGVADGSGSDNVSAAQLTGLKVEGRLRILGTESSPVSFGPVYTFSGWGGIEITKSGHLDMFYAQLSAAGLAVSFSGGSGDIQHSSFTENIDAIVVANSSPHIAGNLIQRNTNGIVVLTTSNPKIVNGNVITDNAFGIRIENSNETLVRANLPKLDDDDILPYNTSAYLAYFDLPDLPAELGSNPAPVITGNTIAQNTTLNIYTFGFYDAPQVRINARNNWWGGIDLGIISQSIYDYTEMPETSPVVDYSYYLSASGGAPVSGNYLNGPLLEDTQLLANTTYTVLGDLAVPEGLSLSAAAGAVVKFPYRFKLTVYGHLAINGSAQAPVRMYSSAESGTWKGITILHTKQATLDVNYAIISSSDVGFLLLGDSLEAPELKIRNSQFQNNAKPIWISGNASPLIENNTFSGYETALTVMTGLDTDNVTTKVGITLSTALIQEYEAAGVSLNPLPVVIGNQFNSDALNYVTGTFVNGMNTRLAAQKNWWGSTNIAYISDRIIDFTDNGSSHPVVDYSDFLAEPNGAAVPGNYLNGLIPEDRVLTGARTYTALGDIHIPSGITLGIEPDTFIDFRANFGFFVDGRLLALGENGHPILFSSSVATQGEIIWKGISVRLASRENIFDFVSIQHAAVGLSIAGYIEPQLEVNYEAILEPWTRVFRSQFLNNTVGIRVTGAAAPQILQSTIALNQFGIELNGGSAARLSPQPVINNSDLSGNAQVLTLRNYNWTEQTLAQSVLNTFAELTWLAVHTAIEVTGTEDDLPDTSELEATTNTVATELIPALDTFLKENEVNSYGYKTARSSKMVDARFNYWGNNGPVVGENIILENTPEAAIDYSQPLEASKNAATILTMSPTYDYFSPNGDGRKDSIVLSADLSAISAWRLDVINQSGQVINSSSGVGQQATMTWNGSVVSGGIAPEGEYGFVVTTEKDDSSQQQVQFPAVVIDVTAPVATFASPANNAYIVSDNLAITGKASDANFMSYSLERYLLPAPGGGRLVVGQSSTPVAATATIGNWEAINDAEGKYRFELAVSDRAGNIKIATRDLTSDRTLPAASITSPAENATVSFDVAFKGVATDANFANYQLDVKPIGPTLYEAIQSSSTAVNGGVLATWNTLGSSTKPVVTTGTYTARLLVKDKAGHQRYSADRTLVVDHDLLVAPTLSATSFDPTSATIQISTALKQAYSPGVDIAVVIYPAAESVATPVRSIVVAGKTTTESVAVTWNGRDDAGKLLSDGSYRIAVEARVRGAMAKRYELANAVNLAYSIGNGAGVMPGYKIAKPLTGTKSRVYYSIPYDVTTTIAYYSNAEYAANGNKLDGLQPVFSITRLDTGTGQKTHDWDGRHYDGTPAIGGDYRVEFNFALEGGQVKSVKTPNLISVAHNILSNMSFSANTLDFSIANESVQIPYTLSLAAKVELYIVPGDQYINALPKPELLPTIYKVTHNQSAAGNYSFAWNGLDNAGQRVMAGSYRAVLLVYVGGDLLERLAATDIGALQSTPAIHSQSATQSADRNEPLWYILSPTATNMKARFVLNVIANNTPYSIPTAFVTAKAGQQTLLSWNGINPYLGKPHYGNVDVIIQAYKYASNEIFVWGDAKILPPTGFVNVVSDPYKMYLSYGQFTNFKYQLTQSAYVTLKILPAGVIDQNDPRAITVVNNQLRSAGAQQVQWDAILASDANKLRRVISENGAHSFVITARSVASGDLDEQRGLVNVQY
jgi:parallel beta-helix repeat protein